MEPEPLRSPAGFDGPLPPAPFPRPRTSWWRRNQAPLVLVGLSILIPELLTGSTPVLALLNPVGVLFLLGLYGGGVLLIRELSVRGGRGWGTLLLLGGAYGVAEEGLGTKTFFDAQLVHNTFSAPWGHYLGVNWAWAVQLGIFHAVFSIGLPILLVQLLYPETRGHPLLSLRGGWVAGGAFGVTVALMLRLFNASYALPAYLVVGSLGVIAVLSVVAWNIPTGWRTGRSPALRATPPAHFAVGAIFVWSFFGINWLLAAVTLNAPLVVGAQLALAALTLRWVVRHLGAPPDPSAQTGLAAGLLSFLVVMAVVEDLFGDWGAVVPALIIVYLLFRLRARYPWHLSASASPGVRLSTKEI